MDPAPDLASPTDWPEFADEWRAFRSAATEVDELWGFNTVSARDGRDGGEQGFALLRDGTVVDWFITAVVDRAGPAEPDVAPDRSHSVVSARPGAITTDTGRIRGPACPVEMGNACEKPLPSAAICVRPTRPD